MGTVVEEDVAFGPENLGIPPKEIRKRVDEALDTIGMSEYKKCAALAVRRPETEGGHSGDTRHETEVHRARRGNRHAGSYRQERSHAHFKKTEQ